MKRNSLTTAVVAGIAGTVGIANLASAVNLNPDGLGQVLIYPYYTVNSRGADSSNLQTLFSIVNTTNQGKAVKVRFVEGYNSREVRDFHLYLSPYDVWTANLFKLPDQAQANLVTSDESCTVPRIKGAPASSAIGILPNGRSYLRFTNARYSGSYADGGPTGLERTREGHFEIIEMGTVTNETEDSLDAITHGPAGIPANCGQVNGAWVAAPTAGYWIVDPSTDIDPPTGGLFGNTLLLDLNDGTSAGYSADAIDAFLTGDQNLHNVPGDVNPSLSSVGGVDPNVTAYVFDNGSLIQATYGVGTPTPSRNVDAVSALFMHNNLFNEYVLGGIASASTEWVVTFPTKRYYVDPVIVGAAAIPPFPTRFTSAGGGTARVEVGLFPFNREEASPGSCTGADADNPNCGVCFSPCDDATFDAPVLSYESQIISFQNSADVTGTSPVLGSKLVSNVDVRADNLNDGWMRLGLNPTTQPHVMAPSTEGEVFSGLPATGFSIQNFVNANATPGRLANYSGLWKHKGSRSCVAGSPTAPLACS